MMAFVGVATIAPLTYASNVCMAGTTRPVSGRGSKCLTRKGIGVGKGVLAERSTNRRWHADSQIVHGIS